MAAKTTKTSIAAQAEALGLNTEPLKSSREGTADSIYLGWRQYETPKGPIKVLFFEDGSSVCMPRTWSLNFTLVPGMRVAAYWEDGKFHLSALS